jgi:quercetin dioxygenase-like cupin family protein
MLAAAAAATVAWATLAQSGPKSELTVADLDVPQDKGPQHVTTLVREFPMGGSSGWHRHAGTEIAYLIAGQMTLEREGQAMRLLHPGDSFVVARGVAHNGVNIGKEPARLVITYLVDKGSPLRIPAPGH